MRRIIEAAWRAAAWVLAAAIVTAHPQAAPIPEAARPARDAERTEGGGDGLPPGWRRRRVAPYGGGNPRSYFIRRKV